jgi:hypothetical protein
MSEIVHERRRLLLSTAAWVGGLAAVAVTRPRTRFRSKKCPRPARLAAPMPIAAAALRSTRR